MNFIKFGRSRSRMSTACAGYITPDQVVLIISESENNPQFNSRSDINSGQYRVLAVDNDRIQFSVPFGGTELFYKRLRTGQPDALLYNTEPTKEECIALVNKIKSILDNALNDIRDEKEIIQEAVKTIRNQDISDAEAADKLSELIKKFK